MNFNTFHVRFKHLSYRWQNLQNKVSQLPQLEITLVSQSKIFLCCKLGKILSFTSLFVSIKNFMKQKNIISQSGERTVNPLSWLADCFQRLSDQFRSKIRWFSAMHHSCFFFCYFFFFILRSHWLVLASFSLAPK